MKIARNILKQGFSLIELLVVVAIIGILAAIGSVGYTRYIKISQDKAQLANLVELMEGLGTTFIAFKTNQIKPNDPVFTYCSYNFQQNSMLNDGFAYNYDPSNPPLDCVGSLTTNFKSPYNNKDVGGINGNYILSPCMPIFGSSVCGIDPPQPLASYANTPSPNPSGITCPSGDCSVGFQYSDGTPVTTQGKIFYTDINYTPSKPDGSPGCRIIYFQACHTDGNEDDGMLILNPPCYGPNPDPSNAWGPRPDGSWGYSLPNVQVTNTETIVQNTISDNSLPMWTGAKIVKSY